MGNPGSHIMEYCFVEDVASMAARMGGVSLKDKAVCQVRAARSLNPADCLVFAGSRMDAVVLKFWLFFGLMTTAFSFIESGERVSSSEVGLKMGRVTFSARTNLTLRKVRRSELFFCAEVLR